MSLVSTNLMWYIWIVKRRKSNTSDYRKLLQLERLDDSDDESWSSTSSDSDVDTIPLFDQGGDNDAKTFMHNGEIWRRS